MKKIILFLGVSFSFLLAYSQKNGLDSLQRQIEQMPPDTVMLNRGIELLNQLYRLGQNDRGVEWGKKLLLVAEKQGYPSWEASIANRLGTILANMGGYEKEALEYHQKALKIRKKLDDLQGVGISLNNLGNVYRNLAQDSKAIEHYRQSLEICEQINDMDGVAYALKNIAIIYEYQLWYDKALEFHLKALKIREKLSPNQTQHAASLYNTGVAYFNLRQYALALHHLEKALVICQQEKYEQEDEVLMQIGKVYARQERYDKAVQYYEAAFQKAKAFGKKRVLSDILVQLSRAYLRLNDPTAAKKYLEIHQQLLDTVDYRRGRLEYHLTCYHYDSLTNQEISALRHFRLYSLTKDSIYNETTSNQMKQAQTAIAVLQKESEVKLEKTEEKYQKRALMLIVLFLTIVVLILFFTIFSKNQDNRLLKRQQQEISLKNTELITVNEEIRQQQEEILSQRDQISLQKDEITEASQQLQNNIRSAFAIQQAVLPSPRTLSEHLGEYFVLYRPKDVVSGDFYWINPLRNKTILAVADCTGHGVSGAFMSLIGINLLNRITNVYHFSEPVEILNQLQAEIRWVLHQDETQNHEGMDLGIITWHRETENEYRIVFAGAHRPLFYCSAQTCQLLKGTRKSIGGRQNPRKTFDHHSILLPSQSTLYLFTDGFADQNNPQRQSFTEKRLLEKIEEWWRQPMNEQKIRLDDVLDEHKQQADQRDDILVMGFRLT